MLAYYSQKETKTTRRHLTVLSPLEKGNVPFRAPNEQLSNSGTRRTNRPLKRYRIRLHSFSILVALKKSRFFLSSQIRIYSPNPYVLERDMRQIHSSDSLSHSVLDVGDKSEIRFTPPPRARRRRKRFVIPCPLFRRILRRGFAACCPWNLVLLLTRPDIALKC